MISKLNQKLKNVISTCILSFVVFSETRVMIFLFHIGKTNLGASIEMFCSLITVNSITSVPFVESHSAHDIVIRHRVKTVKGILDLLLGTDSGLEASSTSSRSIAIPVHDLFFIITPRFEK